jgi:hypothetical protein
MAGQYQPGDVADLPGGGTATFDGQNWVVQGQATTQPQASAPPLQVAAPENKTLSEMKGLTKAGGSGLIRGAADVVGMPGDVQSLVTAGLDSVMPQPSGQPSQHSPSQLENTINALRGHYIELPTSSDVQKGIEKVTGPLYQPQTGAEKVVYGAGETAPFGMLGGGPILRNMLPNVARAALSGGASEAAGQATQGTPYETPARMLAGMGAYGLGTAAPPTSQFAANTPVRAAAQSLEQNSGMRLPASAISGSRFQATLEGGSPDLSGRGSAAIERQSGVVRPPGNTDQFSRLVEARRNDLQAQGNALGAQTNIPPAATSGLRQQLANDVATHIGHFGGMSVENPAVQRALADYDQAIMGGQPLSGVQYQRLHQAWNADPDTRPMAQHLDAAMDAAHPGVWNDWRQNWADLEGMQAEADRLGGAAGVAPFSPANIVKSMYRRTPMRDTAENLQTVQAAQPKPYNTEAVGGLGHVAGMLGGALGLAGVPGAFHGGFEPGIYGAIFPEVAAQGIKALASSGAPFFRSAAGQNMLRNMDPKIVAGLLAQQGISPKGEVPQPPQGTPQ